MARKCPSWQPDQETPVTTLQQKVLVVGLHSPTAIPASINQAVAVEARQLQVQMERPHVPVMVAPDVYQQSWMAPLAITAAAVAVEFVLVVQHLALAEMVAVAVAVARLQLLELPIPAVVVEVALIKFVDQEAPA